VPARATGGMTSPREIIGGVRGYEISIEDEFARSHTELGMRETMQVPGASNSHIITRENGIGMPDLPVRTAVGEAFGASYLRRSIR